MDKPSDRPPRYDQPSFSSTLLDAIYRSFDDSQQPHPKLNHHHHHLPKHSQRYYYNYKPPHHSNYHNTTTASSIAHRSSATPSQSSAAWAQSTSSSSDCSSYGGFSSSEAESVRLRPIRTAHRPHPLHYHFPAHSQSPASNSTEMNKKKSTSIKSRIKEFRKTKQQLPASPGARLASLLNAIFPKKTSSTVAKPAGSAPEVGSTCSSASSYSRSCLSKTPSTVKRSVRFCPVSVVVGGEEEEEAGEGRREAEGKKRVAEILRGIEREEEEEEEESSDSSSDLFELEDLGLTDGNGNGIVGSERRRFRDELPVYGTTSLSLGINSNSNSNSRGIGLPHAHGTLL